jgi:CRP-like cAMP-binding protein
MGIRWSYSSTQIADLALSRPLAPASMFLCMFTNAQVHQLKAGGVLFAAGDAGDGCYRLDKGLLKVMVTSTSGEERIVAILGPGAVVGELAMIDLRPAGSQQAKKYPAAGDGFCPSCELKTCTPATRSARAFDHFLGQIARRDSSARCRVTPTGNRDAGKFAADATQLPTVANPKA